MRGCINLHICELNIRELTKEQFAVCLSHPYDIFTLVRSAFSLLTKLRIFSPGGGAPCGQRGRDIELETIISASWATSFRLWKSRSVLVLLMKP